MPQPGLQGWTGEFLGRLIPFAGRKRTECEVSQLLTNSGVDGILANHSLPEAYPPGIQVLAPVRHGSPKLAMARTGFSSTMAEYPTWALPPPLPRRLGILSFDRGVVASPRRSPARTCHRPDGFALPGAPHGMPGPGAAQQQAARPAPRLRHRIERLAVQRPKENAPTPAATRPPHPAGLPKPLAADTGRGEPRADFYHFPAETRLRSMLSTAAWRAACRASSSEG